MAKWRRRSAWSSSRSTRSLVPSSRVLASHAASSMAKRSGSWVVLVRSSAPSTSSGSSAPRCAAALRASGELNTLFMVYSWPH
eukprot:11701065-Heterocapsa_arctica.AAC.1